MQGGAEKAGGSSAVRCGGRGRMAVTGEAHQEGDCRARPPLSSWLTVAATLFFSATLSTRILPLLPLLFGCALLSFDGCRLLVDPSRVPGVT